MGSFLVTGSGAPTAPAKAHTSGRSDPPRRGWLPSRSTLSGHPLLGGGLTSQPEVNQLAIFRHRRGFELGATEKQIQVVV